MAHPQMFDDADPMLHRVREAALEFPSAAEKVSHGRPAFFTKRIFAHYGGSIRVDGAHVQHGQSVIVLPDEEEARALLGESRCYRPAYLGSSGWVGVDLDDATDWSEISELLEASYRRTAGPRLVAMLDGT